MWIPNLGEKVTEIIISRVPKGTHVHTHKHTHRYRYMDTYYATGIPKKKGTFIP